jgi:hypothetical protein
VYQLRVGRQHNGGARPVAPGTTACQGATSWHLVEWREPKGLVGSSPGCWIRGGGAEGDGERVRGSFGV